MTTGLEIVYFLPTYMLNRELAEYGEIRHASYLVKSSTVKENTSSENIVSLITRIRNLSL